MRTFDKWFVILRLYALPASIVPLMIAGVYSYKNGFFNFFAFALIFFAGIFIHLSGNLFNTYYDYINGIDDVNSDDIAITRGLIKARDVLKLSFLFMSLSAFIGIFLVLKYSLYNLFYIAIPGFFLTFFYTAKPIAFKYKAFGELVIFMCFGPLIVGGSVLILAKKFIPEAFLYSLPSAFLIVNILLANNIRDDEGDSKKGIKTIVDVFGLDFSKKLYISFIFLSYITAIMLINFSLSLLFLIPSFIPAFNLLKILKNGDFSILVRKTAQFVLLFGILFSLALMFR